LKWSWIPEVDNDYIFAVIGEEFGLLGAAVVIGLFVALALAMFRILGRTQELWARLAIGGGMAWITFQAMVNIAVVLSMLPVLGVPLPMISSGGSSLLANLIAIGVVLSIERHNSGMALPPRQRAGRRR
jgi:cell division protein FtsW